MTLCSQHQFTGRVQRSLGRPSKCVFWASFRPGPSASLRPGGDMRAPPLPPSRTVLVTTQAGKDTNHQIGPGDVTVPRFARGAIAGSDDTGWVTRKPFAV